MTQLKKLNIGGHCRVSEYEIKTLKLKKLYVCANYRFNIDHYNKNKNQNENVKFQIITSM